MNHILDSSSFYHTHLFINIFSERCLYRTRIRTDSTLVLEPSVVRSFVEVLVIVDREEDFAVVTVSVCVYVQLKKS